MNTFHSNIISIYGEKGKIWLDELPQLVAAISSRLDLRDLKEVTNLTYNYVLSGFQGDNPIILKLGLDHKALTREAFALRCFAVYGVVNVLAEDKGMLLLERAVPGTSLKDYFPICHSRGRAGIHAQESIGYRNAGSPFPRGRQWGGAGMTIMLSKLHSRL